MINIKTKVTIIFLLFNIILFLNIFRKLKEPSISTGCRSARKPPPPFTLANCKKKKFLCLSANCTKEINGSLFSETPQGFACLIITVPIFFFKDFKISRAAKISL